MGVIPEDLIYSRLRQTDTNHFDCIERLEEWLSNWAQYARLVEYGELLYLTNKNLKDTSKSSAYTIFNSLVCTAQTQHTDENCVGWIRCQIKLHNDYPCAFLISDSGTVGKAATSAMINRR